jgi:hypothetical protein
VNNEHNYITKISDQPRILNYKLDVKIFGDICTHWHPSYPTPPAASSSAIHALDCGSHAPVRGMPTPGLWSSSALPVAGVAFFFFCGFFVVYLFMFFFYFFFIFMLLGLLFPSRKDSCI